MGLKNEYLAIEYKTLGIKILARELDAVD